MTEEDIKAGVERAAKELERQYDDGTLSWYTDNRNKDGSINWVAVDGNPDLFKLVKVILEKGE